MKKTRLAMKSSGYLSEPISGHSAFDAQNQHAQNQIGDHAQGDAHDSFVAEVPEIPANGFLETESVVPEPCSTSDESIIAVESQPNTDDLGVLHDKIVQNTRCYWDSQKTRIAVGNRIDKMEKEGFSDTFSQPLAANKAAHKGLRQIESKFERELAKLGKQHPLAEWIENVDGVGHTGLCLLLGVCGSLDNFDGVAKLRRYFGMSVDNGRAPKRQRGAKINWSPQGRVVCRQLADSIVRVNRGKYRGAYDRKKAEYAARERTGPSECPFGEDHGGYRGNDKGHKKGAQIKCGMAHVESAAKRYAIKEFLKDMWVEWQFIRGREVQ